MLLLSEKIMLYPLMFLAIALCFATIYFQNPVNAVLSFIGVFIISAGFLLSVGIEFLAITYLVVYIDAVAVFEKPTTLKGVIRYFRDSFFLCTPTNSVNLDKNNTNTQTSIWCTTALSSSATVEHHDIVTEGDLLLFFYWTLGEILVTALFFISFAFYQYCRDVPKDSAVKDTDSKSKTFWTHLKSFYTHYLFFFVVFLRFYLAITTAFMLLSFQFGPHAYWVPCVVYATLCYFYFIPINHSISLT